MKCSHCRFFSNRPHEGAPSIIPGSGHCTRWHSSYQEPETVTSDMVWVEFDEAWGNVVGPDFGCILFESKKEGD